ncbi:CD82 antigen [Sceloporus undulatus]|uniref:CD82 antigen n=1 Tax=Sceloporus undulatus TaxID=8520 RepID=UPI001C4D357E|nr:CD82 antigen [Sceloporus undulatus]XP_042294497.1 CD82 antigen [Sceloporus undulatus]
MGSGCLKVTKYFLFLFNLLFFILGAVILGFGIWILVDKSSFISVLQTSSYSLKVGAYILIGVGAVTMLMGFLGCVGAVNEIRCLLGLYFTCLLLILIAQVAAGLLIYFQRNALKAEMSEIVGDLIQNYNPYDESNRNLETAWDYVQTQLSCCGWSGPENWKNNTVLQEKNQTSYPCSCSNDSVDSVAEVGFCPLETASNTTTFEDWPVRKQGCMKGVQNWLQENLGIILGVCTGVAVVELLGMVLSICLCKNIHTEEYTKVPKY